MHLRHASATKAMQRRRIVIGGRVQGVGFRPFVYRRARQYHLCGFVSNKGSAVEIEIQGEQLAIEGFLADLVQHAPAFSEPVILEIQALDIQLLDSEASRDFAIVASQVGAETNIHIPPDYYLCSDCLAELHHAQARRYHYPFINCTQCGPRYSLIRQTPIDRANTTMADFPLCAACRQEYQDPTDRRFHAQATACAQCGPQLTFRSDCGATLTGAAALDACAAAIRQGHIVIIKGVGGYHLCCDAFNEATIQQLRQRKPRPHKPLALMFPQTGVSGLDCVHQQAQLNAIEAQQILSAARPIVLLQRAATSTLPESIAPGLSRIGIMLPMSPLHELLLQKLQQPVVMTSANLGGEPVLTQEQDVTQRLQPISRHGLHHDRAIQRPIDDAVIQVLGKQVRPLRLGRGMSPLELSLPFTLRQPLLACGGQMKNTIALAWADRIIISPHIGDLHSPRSLETFTQTVYDLQDLYAIEASALVCDYHPMYASSRWAKQQQCPVIEVLHHHAHAACLAGEYPHESRWLIFAWDGVGAGPDGTLWGGEALLGQPGQWQRRASWRAFALPGGEKAARDPWRSALALCWETNRQWQAALPICEADRALLKQSWQNKLRCPRTSAIGRLFDAAAALSGICMQASYEGQAPMWLEQAATQGQGHAIALPVSQQNGLWITDWAPLLTVLLHETISANDKAAIFHHSLVAALVTQAGLLCEQYGEHAIGLCGGVFQNRLLTEAVIQQLSAQGLRVYLPSCIPVNDAGLSYGQIIEAAAYG